MHDDSRRTSWCNTLFISLVMVVTDILGVCGLRSGEALTVDSKQVDAHTDEQQ